MSLSGAGKAQLVHVEPHEAGRDMVLGTKGSSVTTK
jgi:hypothetical protein